MKTLRKTFLLLVLVLLSTLVACENMSFGGNKTEIEEVTFDNMVTTMTKGEILEIEYSLQDDVIAVFESSNESVATVEENVVTAVGIGSFKLTATFTLDDQSKEYEFEIEVVGISYSIIYELDGGKNPVGAPTNYQEGTYTTLPEPTKDGYTFLGWSLVPGSTVYIDGIAVSVY